MTVSTFRRVARRTRAGRLAGWEGRCDACNAVVWSEDILPLHVSDEDGCRERRQRIDKAEAGHKCGGGS